MAPVRTGKQRRPKSITRWLSKPAIAAKRQRRRLEKAWRRSGAEQDRKAYRVACREANKLINESRKDHNAQRISSCADSKARWTVVKDLLHSSETDHTATDEENLK